MPRSVASQNVFGLARTFKRLRTNDPLMQCLAPRLARNFATTIEIPVAEIAQQEVDVEVVPKNVSAPTSASHVLTTLYSWPSLEPKKFAYYGSKYLDMPLRRDILHRAVIYEADGTRQGTASTKWRGDVHGSNRKIAPQKGLGRARVGDKKSPIRRGGGVAFGPHPRDFSTELPRKIYDIAWRTALSYRYRRGELIVLDGRSSTFKAPSPRFLHNMFEANQWGKGFGRSLIVTDGASEEFTEHMRQVDEHGEIKTLKDVDVKDLLKFGRVIIDQRSLQLLFATHSSDLGNEFSAIHVRRTVKRTGTIAGITKSILSV